MMSCRKVLLSAVAVLAPPGLLVAASGSASAFTLHKLHPNLTGTIQCPLSGDMTFSPPLTALGTAPTGTLKKEVVTLNLTPSECVPSAPIIPQETVVTVKPIKQKSTDATAPAKGKVLGACLAGFDPALKVHELWTWGDNTSGNIPIPYNASKVHIPSMGEVANAGSDETGFAGVGKSKGSYKGGAALDLFFQPASWAALQAVCQPGGLGSVSELDLDPATSVAVVGSDLVAQS
jgi:hypothetical protein